MRSSSFFTSIYTLTSLSLFPSSYSYRCSSSRMSIESSRILTPAMLSCSSCSSFTADYSLWNLLFELFFHRFRLSSCESGIRIASLRLCPFHPLYTLPPLATGDCPSHSSIFFSPPPSFFYVLSSMYSFSMPVKLSLDTTTFYDTDSSRSTSSKNMGLGSSSIAGWVASLWSIERNISSYCCSASELRVSIMKLDRLPSLRLVSYSSSLSSYGSRSRASWSSVSSFHTSAVLGGRVSSRRSSSSEG